MFPRWALIVQALFWKGRFRVQGLGFRVEASGFYGSMFRVSDHYFFPEVPRTR